VNASAGALPDIIWHDCVGSTNEEAHARLAGQNVEPAWVAAAEQTHGRGRLGRNWVSRPGNLYASLVWPANVELKRLASLSLVAGLAVRDAVVETGIAVPVQLKWPNDVLVSGQKVSGVLIESVALTGCNAAIVGCGLNLAHHPPDTRWPATSLAACGITIEPRDMLAKLRSTMHSRLTQWSNGSGLAGIQVDWMSVAMGRGRRISVEGGRQGIFSGLSEDGALVLTLKDGSVFQHLAGDVEWMEQNASISID